MANMHYGRIGDVWKHGPLVEVILAIRPRLYAETHAGSAVYPLTPSPERAYGVYHLLEDADGAAEVADSEYLHVLRAHAETAQFPGSPAVAMAVLGRASRYLFCDLDPQSVRSIRVRARGRSLNAHVEAVAAEGLGTVRAAMRALPREERQHSLVLVDPYQPFDDTDKAGTPLQLLAELAAHGVPALLWYGFGDAAEQRSIHHKLRDTLAGSDPQRLWCAEMIPAYLDDPAFPFHSGYIAAGLVGVNLPDNATQSCERYGRGLEQVYALATVAGGHDGALRLHRPRLIE